MCVCVCVCVRARARAREKSVGTTELHYSTKKRYHVLTILSMVKTWYRFFVL